MCGVAGTLEFDAAHSRSVLQALVARGEPLRLQVTLRGAATVLADRAVLQVAEGRVHLARTSDRSGVDALVRILLADGGTIEVINDPPPGNVANAPAFEAIFAEAERRAQQLTAPIAPVGGLGAVLRADLDQLVAHLRQVPEAANRVMRLADGRRSVAQLLSSSPYDEVLTARIIGKLHAVGVFVNVAGAPAAPTVSEFGPTVDSPGQWLMPDRGWGETAELPGEDDLEVEGPEVSGDISHWLAAEVIPPPLLSDDAFSQAFVSGPQAAAAEAPAAGVAVAAAPVVASPDGLAGESSSPSISATPVLGAPHAEAADEADFAAAGVGSGPNPQLIAALLLLGALIVGAVFVLGGRGPSVEPLGVDAGPASVLTATTATSTVAEPPLTDEPEPDLVGPAEDALRRTIASPDAPSDVREAESLWESGQYDDAGRLLRRLRRTRSRDSTVFILSGQVYVDTGKLDRANQMANRALALNRRSFRAWVLKGSVQQFQRKTRGALAAYRRALKLGPEHEMSDEIRAVVAQLERESQR